MSHVLIMMSVLRKAQFVTRLAGVVQVMWLVRMQNVVFHLQQPSTKTVKKILSVPKYQIHVVEKMEPVFVVQDCMTSTV